MSPGNRKPPEKTEVKGWTVGAAIRNRDFLMSVDVGKLNPDSKLFGAALTLTVRDCPPSAEDWQKLLIRWIDRQRDGGMVRLHWCVEMQRRGVPHLHCAIWFPRLFRISGKDMPGAAAALYAVQDWLELTEAYRTSGKGQDCREISNAAGWFEYLAKHASRGTAHYQRIREALPEGWQKTGRLWGKRGDWPVDEPLEVTLNEHQAFKLRRYVQRYYLSRVGNRGRAVSYGRRMRKSNDPNRSRLIKYALWMPQSVATRLLQHLATET